MNKLIAVLSGITSIGVVATMGMSIPQVQKSGEYQQIPGSSTGVRVMQSSGCPPPSPSPTPGGNPKKPAKPGLY